MATPKPDVETWNARYTYRLRVSSTASKALRDEWHRCRWIWNECVHQSKTAHSLTRPCGPAGLDKLLTAARASNAWLREGSSVPQQQTIRDYAKSRAKALKDIKEKLPTRQRAGMPKPKKRRTSRTSLNYTRRGFSIKGGRLILSGGTRVTVVWSRELPTDPSSVRVYQDSLGHWYASFVVAAETRPLPETGQAIGIDWGVRDIATTTSDAHDLKHPQHGARSAGNLAHYQRMMARRKPPKGKPASAGYREAKHHVARLHKKVVRQRQDTSRKWAKSVVRDHDHIAVEDFKPKFLAKSTMARKAADAAIGSAKRELITMAGKHGRAIHLVNPAHTTMDCGTCGARAKHRLPLSQRTYTCIRCGAVSPRDKNSALVMLNRAGLNPAGVDRVRLDSPPDGQAA